MEKMQAECAYQIARNGYMDAWHWYRGAILGKNLPGNQEAPYLSGAADKYRETLNKSSAAGRRIFCPIRSVLKVGNTYSIPPLSELSAEPKSSAASSCRFNQSFLRITKGLQKKNVVAHQ